MARYTAEESKAMEYQGAETFRIEKDGGRAQVVFLYTDAASIDGWAVHRLPGANLYTYTVDCPRGPKDPIDNCPACKAGEALSTRIFVRMLDLSTGKVMIWDKPASFRQTIVGFMHYFPCLYKQKYEITRTGTGLNTKYNFQSIGDSGIDEKQYAELIAQCDEVCGNYVRPIEKYEEVKARSEAAQNEAVQVDNQQGGAPQGAWGQNQAPSYSQNQNWGQQQNFQQPAQNWGQQQNFQQPAQGWGQTNQNQQPAQNQQSAQNFQNNSPQGQPSANQGWGQAPQGAWTQNPQN